MAKLTKAKVSHIKRLLESGLTRRHVAKTLDICLSSVKKYARLSGIKSKPYDRQYLKARTEKGRKARQRDDGYSFAATQWAAKREEIASLGWPVGMLPLDCQIANAVLSRKIPLTAVDIALAINRKLDSKGRTDGVFRKRLQHMCLRLWLKKLPRSGKDPNRYVASEYLVEYLQQGKAK